MDNMRFEGVTLLADDVASLARFYEDVLGFDVTEREADYVAFDGGGKRLAIFQRSGMSANTHDHPSYRESRRGQVVELNFECPTPEIVRTKYAELVGLGAVDIAAPVEKPWGHLAGFFGDPEGNIHSIFAVLPEA
jgi:catechol-2,3-dioxygenase